MSTLTIAIVVVFVIGYACIALEALTKVNKAAIALLMCVFCWTLLMLAPGSYYPTIAADGVIHQHTAGQWRKYHPCRLARYGRSAHPNG